MNKDLALVVELLGKDSGALALLDNAQKGMGGMSGAAGVAAKAVLGVGVAAGGAMAVGLGASVKAAADFEETMSGVRAVSGATADEMKALGGLALKLGKDTSFSASEAAAGIEELVKGGLTIPDIMNGAAEATLNLAAAGGVALPDAAEIAANALAMFNLQGSQMAMVADQIAGAANASSLSVTDFKFSLGAVGSIAAAAGQSFQSTATAIALMGAAGIKGSDAGTSLKAMLNNLQPATKAQTKAMRELGILTADGTNKFLTAEGKFKDMAGISAVLQGALKDLTEAQRIQALETLFGSDGMRAGVVLAKAGAEGYEKMAAAMGKVTAAQVAKEKLDNLKGSLQALKGSLETAAITFGLPFLPLVKGAVDAGTALLNNLIPRLERLGELAAGNIQSGLAAVSGLLNNLGLVMGVFRSGDIQAGLLLLGNVLGRDLGAAAGPLQTVVGGFQALVPQVQALATFVHALMTGEGGFTRLVGSLAGMSPIAQAVALAFAQLWGTVQLVAGRVQQAIAGDIAGAVTGLLDMLVNNRLDLIETLAGWGKAFVEWVAPMIPPFLAEVGKVGTAVLEWAVAKAPEIATRMLGWANAVAAWVAPAIPRLLEEAAKLGTALMEWAVATAPEIAARLVAWTDALVAWVVAARSPLQTELDGVQGQVTGWVGTNGPVLAQQFVTDWLPGAIDWVVQAAVDVMPKLLAFVTGVLDWAIANGPTLARTFLSEWLPAAIEWLAEAAIRIVPELAKLLATMVAWVVTTGIPKATELFGRMGVAIIQGLVEGAERVKGMLFSKLQSIATEALEAAKRALKISSPSQVFAEQVGEPIVEGIAVGVERGAADLMEALTATLEPVIEFARETVARYRQEVEPTTAATEEFADITDALASVFGDALNPALGLAAELLIPELADQADMLSGEFFGATQAAYGLASAIRAIPRFGGGGFGGGGFGGGGGGIPDFGGSNPFDGRAMGGPVTAGRPYLVGELGPEVIVPRAAGTVVPNHALGGGLDYDRLGAAVARALAGVSLSVDVDDIHAGMLRKKRRGATMGLA